MTCAKPELDLFSVTPVQTSVLKTTEVAYKPINALTTDPSTIEFVSLGQGDTYRDLSSIYLRLNVQLMKDSNGASYTASDTTKSSVVNNILHSIFRQVSIYLNGVPIAQTNDNYGYRAYFENLLNYGTDACTTHMNSIGWAPDTPGKLNSLTVAENLGLKKRQDMFNLSHPVELMGAVHVDMLNQNRLLLNNVDLRIIFSLQNTKFYVMEADASDSFLKINSATLYMNHITLNPSLLLANEIKLGKQLATYEYRRVEVKSFTVNSGAQTISLDNVVIGQIPNILLFAMVDNSSYTGKRSENPYYFKHNNISQFNVVLNGVSIPNQPIEFNFDTATAPLSTRGYQTLFKDTGIHYFDQGHQITKDFFDNGCFVLATDLTADKQISKCANLNSEGTVRIEARFAKPLEKTINCLIYCEYDSLLKIDKNRSVYTQF